MQKLYCYLDETGQDTAGGLFVVAAVITGLSERASGISYGTWNRRQGRVTRNGPKPPAGNGKPIWSGWYKP